MDPVKLPKYSILEDIILGVYEKLPPTGKRVMRLNTPFGHWLKWYLGHGYGCFVCTAVVRWPWLKDWIPYSFDGLTDEQIQEYLT